MLNLSPDIVVVDIDNRGEQNFLRIYYTFPMQNTRNNMLEVKKEILQAIEIKRKVERMLTKFKNHVDAHNKNDCICEADEYDLECRVKTLQHILDNTIVQESGKN